MAQDHDYLYLVEILTLGQTGRLLRTLKSPTATFEVIAETVPTAAAAFEVAGDNLYWFENVSMGEVRSCPKSDCRGQPKTVIPGLNTPTAFALDDSSVYVLEPPESAARYVDNRSRYEITVTRTGRILKCPLSGCTNPQVIFSTTAEPRLDGLAVDDRFVYFSGSNCTAADYDSAVRGWKNCSFLAVIPK